LTVSKSASRYRLPLMKQCFYCGEVVVRIVLMYPSGKTLRKPSAGVTQW
jgi:hypothetical protein